MRHGHPPDNKSQGPHRALAAFKNRRDARVVGPRPGRPRPRHRAAPHVVNLDLANVAEDYVHGSAGTVRGRPERPTPFSLGGRRKSIDLLRADRKVYRQSLAHAGKLPGFEALPFTQRHPLGSSARVAGRAGSRGGRFSLAGGRSSGEAPAGRMPASQRLLPHHSPRAAGPSSKDRADRGAGAEVGPNPMDLPRNSKLCSSTRALDEANCPAADG